MSYETAPPPDTEDAFATPAWLLVGMTRSEPGMLVTGNGRLWFATEDEVLLDLPLGEIESVVFPWYYFGGGCKIRANGEQLRLSFVKPNDAPDLPASLLDGASLVLQRAGAVADLVGAARKFGDITRGRAAGRAWRERLPS